MSDIFISYSREDRARAERVAKALETFGWSVWWDRSVPVGSTFDDVIEEAIDAAKCVIVLWSETSVASRWVRTEAQEGLDRNVLLPILIDDVKIPLAFRRVQAANLTGWDGREDAPAFRRLVADVESVAGVPEAQKSTAPEGPSDASPEEVPPPAEPTEPKSEVRLPSDRVEGPPVAPPNRSASPTSAPSRRPARDPWWGRAWVRAGTIGVIGVAVAVTAMKAWPFGQDADPVSQENADSVSRPPSPPVIEQFSANQSSITEGDPLTLTWRTAEAERVELEPGGPVALNGSADVSPATTTTYTLVASGPGGEVRDSVEIAVAESPDPDPPDASFTARASAIERGSSTTLQWSTTGATTVRLDGETVPGSSSRRVTPASDKTYRLLATGPGGTVEREVTISVTEPAPDPPTASLTAQPASIERGSSTTLRWSTANATTVRLNGTAVEANGSQNLTPDTDATYRLEVTGPGGRAEDAVTVVVTAPAGPTPPAHANSRTNPVVWIEGGTFTMGSAEGPPHVQPEHQVTISGFWIQQHEVTNSEYRRFDATHSFPSGADSYPAVGLTWQQAMAYAEEVGGSLPTEAQWEYAARGTEGRTYPWGEAAPNCNLAQFNPCRGETVEVKSRPAGATPEGVYDLAGNAAEWTADWYGPYPSSPVRDPTGPHTGTTRSLRGGSWGSTEGLLRTWIRIVDSSRVDLRFIGFRVVWPAEND